MKTVMLLAAAHAMAAAGLCVTDLDCQLNGACRNGVCACDKGWKGVYCETVAEGGGWVVYPEGPETASWGASVVKVGDVYHGYFNVVCQEETCAHTERAMIVHGTSNAANGAFVYSDIALLPELENIHAVYDKRTSSYLLYFFDHLNPMTPTNCTSSSFKGVNPGRLGVASSPSPYGPWNITHPTINGPTVGGYGINPSPWILSNGSYLLAYRYNPDTTGDMTEAIGLAIADDFTGPYNIINSNLTGGPNGVGGRAGTAEDPFLYATPRGYHILYHQYNGSIGGPQCDYDNGLCDYPGGHAYSPDMRTWYRSPYPAYTTTTTVNGQSINFDFRERPGIFFDETGEPLYFYTGVETGKKSGPPCRSQSVANVLI